MSTHSTDATTTPRRRLPRDVRRRNLIAVSWRIAQAEGADALTLGRLAEQAEVAKPVVYDHFGTRNGLLAALYQDYDQRQAAAMEEALAASPATLRDKARVIADAYVDCVLAQGRELFGVAAALEGSPELEALKRQCNAVFLEKCKAALDPFAGASVSRTSLLGAFGAAEALSLAAAAGEIGTAEAKRELAAVILSAAQRRQVGILR
ncbi:TetR/AcrR family transcriptional regulator [Chelatococcus reniformis]|uniref:Transcriptional regulator n=1 Tax=Chelatococcus reniformis TaxID=1494448 RepID=A0A916UZH9_9HYPH|nr:TetR/AcrR family transcriptional regulator [Chelatococcus reniformis]GGC94531.1 transcriptional regulator [Chelatococcus reniformis]